jgi:large subunit ribosomal protein L17
VLHEKIETTEAKAKEIRPLVEKLVTKAKNGTVETRRAIVSKIGREATKKIVDTLANKYKDKKGGYTRITKVMRRMSDGSKMAIIEFV